MALLSKILFGILAIVVLGVSALLFNYFTWRNEKLTELRSGGQLIETQAGPIEYVLKGNQGPVRLFFHGSPGGYDAAPEAGDNYRLLVPSRAGYLSTSIDIGRTPEEQAYSYAALIDALEIDEPIQVMGVSGGGPYAIAFASHFPQKTSALILISAISQPNNYPQVPAIMQTDFFSWLIFSALTKYAREALIRMIIANEEGVKEILEDDDKIDRVLSIIWSQWPMSLRKIGRQNDILQYAQLSLDADKITVPTLIIHGTEDATVPFANSVQLAEIIPKSTLHAIKGGGHMISFTHEEELKNKIMDFLGSQ